MASPSEPYREIPLTQGQSAIVDPEDFAALNLHKWTSQWNPRSQSFYAVRSVTIANGKRTLISMHRQILGLTYGDKLTVDHCNRDTLDCRRANMRLATHAEQQRNKRTYQNNSTGYKGVYRDGNGFRIALRYNGRLLDLGRRDTAKEAYSVYCEAALRLHGSFASL